MPTGTIAAIIEDRGFGFIRQAGSDRKELFFHVNQIADQHDLPFDETLIEREVAFEVESTDRGPRAVNVRPAR